MNKERELLIRARDVLRGLKETHYDLYWDIQTALDQPEQEPVAWMQDDIELYVQEEKDIVRGYVIPLYTAPPKREPFGPEELMKQIKTNRVFYQEGYAQAELDLKREPIEDGELEVWYSQHPWAMEKQEYMWGFRDAEKAHGITGVDDE
jgi:hypothetical protein